MTLKRLLVRWAPVVAIGIGPALVYLVAHVRDENYLSGFMGNWLATVIGLVVGIPIALALSEREQRAEASKEEQRQAIARAERRVQLLRLLEAELKHNAHNLGMKRAIVEDKGPDVLLALFPVSRLKYSVWRAISDGGELSSLGDVQLLVTIAEVYDRIHASELQDEMVWQMYCSMVATRPLYSAEKLKEKDVSLGAVILQFDQYVQEGIDMALKAIQKALAADVDANRLAVQPS